MKLRRLKNLKQYENYLNESENQINKDFFEYVQGWQLETWIDKKVSRYRKNLLKEINDFFVGKIVKFKNGKEIKVKTIYVERNPSWTFYYFISDKNNYHKIENIVSIKGENELNFEPLPKFLSDIDPYGEEEWGR